MKVVPLLLGVEVVRAMTINVGNDEFDDDNLHFVYIGLQVWMCSVAEAEQNSIWSDIVEDKSL